MRMGNSRAAVDKDEINSDSTDRISELPQPLLHHILCFLSQKQAVQTCVLSKSWRYLGSTRPKLEFLYRDYYCFQTFFSILGKTLQMYHDQKLFVQEFHVEFRTPYDRKTVLFLKTWFPIIVSTMSSVRAFDLSFNWLNKSSMLGYFDLPSSVFENSKSLRNLGLRGFRFSQNLPIDYKVKNLKHLRTLTLKDVHIVDETFQTIMSSCHYIERVVLDRCDGLTTIRLMNHYYLKRFDLCCERPFKEDIFLVDVPNLESMKIKTASVWFNIDRHHNMYFPALKSLHLMGLRLMPTLPSLDILSNDFPCLQHFYIEYCTGFGELRVSNRSIKYLTITRLDSSTKVVVDAPNLALLDYRSSIPVDISFATISNDCISKMKPSFNVRSEDGFLELRKLLEAVSQSKIFLHFPYDEDYRDEDDINGKNDYYHDKPLPVEYLLLDYVGRGYFYSEAFLNHMFRYCRPRNILEQECTQRSRFLCKMLLLTPKEGSRRFSWQRDLEKVNMEVWDQERKEWQSVEGTTFLESGAHSSSYVHKDQFVVWFKLKWREFVRPSHTIPIISQSAMPQRLTVSSKASQFLRSLVEKMKNRIL